MPPASIGVFRRGVGRGTNRRRRLGRDLSGSGGHLIAIWLVKHKTARLNSTDLISRDDTIRDPARKMHRGGARGGAGRGAEREGGL